MVIITTRWATLALLVHAALLVVGAVAGGNSSTGNDSTAAADAYGANATSIR